MRYTGPKAKRCRAMGGVNLYGNEKFDGHDPLLPQWLTVEANLLTITLNAIPSREELDQSIIRIT